MKNKIEARAFCLAPGHHVVACAGSCSIRMWDADDTEQDFKACTASPFGYHPVAGHFKGGTCMNMWHVALAGNDSRPLICWRLQRYLVPFLLFQISAPFTIHFQLEFDFQYSILRYLKCIIVLQSVREVKLNHLVTFSTCGSIQFMTFQSHRNTKL